MPDYILRDIDGGFWKRCKTRAAKEGRPLRWVLLRLLELYVTVGLEAIEAGARKEG